MKSFHVPLAICPNCQHGMDRAANLDAATAPIPGDVTVCIRCGNVNVFGDDMTLRPITDAEAASLTGEQHARIANAVHLIEARQRGRDNVL